MSIIFPFSTESHPDFLSMNKGFVSLWVSMDMNSIARFQARTYKIVEFWDDEFEKADVKSKKA
ncbi:hypothetical protein JHK85_001071 [Glycine max]|nr:hypothetical protein JHK87_001047 [Glycine soja]KAG5068694.1 hypothetical protein JHK85_001071 [Glycine max]KAG5088424.1 hypothetical protein JHK86_001036 [Glycine max]